MGEEIVFPNGCAFIAIILVMNIHLLCGSIGLHDASTWLPALSRRGPPVHSHCVQ